MRFPRASFERFASKLKIPSKEQGHIPFASPYGTQTYMRDRIEAGLERGIHDFVILKGRQQGITTDLDTLDLFWTLSYGGTIGMLVADDDDNQKVRRAVILQMMSTLPKEFRRRVGLNNGTVLEFLASKQREYTGAWLMFDHAGKRENLQDSGKGDNLGRSRGLNYLHADEVGSWVDEKAVSALQAALAETFPTRLYIWASTARGFNVFRDIYLTAEKVPTSAAIFIGWYHKAEYSVPEDDAHAEVWDAYGWEPTREEVQWVTAVRRRYGLEIDASQLVWRRWQLASKFRGDEVMLAQEHPNLPEEAFQSWGDKFIQPFHIRRLYDELEVTPAPQAYRFEYATTLDATDAHRVELGDERGVFHLWEAPDPVGVYVVAGHPWGSSSPTATEWTAQVFRCYPDLIEQVAEFGTEELNGYQFAWVMAYLCGLYRGRVDMPWEIIEVGGTGMQVMEELDRIRNFDYGLAPAAPRDHQDFTGTVNRYIWRKSDALKARGAHQMKSNRDERTRLYYTMRDEVEREHVTIRSRRLIDELAMLRRLDADNVAGSGDKADARVHALALAVEHWLKNLMPELSARVQPKVTPAPGPRHMGEALMQHYLSRRVLRR